MLIIEKGSDLILGVGLVGLLGHGAGELIGEGVVALEMRATVTDLADCVHPLPTLCDTLIEAAESYFGHSTHAHQRWKSQPS